MAKPKRNKAVKVGDIRDRCQTPAYAVSPIAPYLLASDTPIWEPATGEGYLAQALVDLSLTVYTSDLMTGQDFFCFTPELPGKHRIVTNPPYSIKEAWIKRCFAMRVPFALLVPVETIALPDIQVDMDYYGAELMLLDKRVNFKMPNKGWKGSSAQFPVLWLCHGILPEKLMYGHIAHNVIEIDPLVTPSLFHALTDVTPTPQPLFDMEAV